MSLRRWTPLPMALAMSVSALACVPHGTMEDPEPPAPLPEQYSAGEEKTGSPDQQPQDASKAERGAKAAEGQWWKTFGDPQLAALVDRAVTRSYDLDAAHARLEQAEARATMANAPRWPQAQLQGNASRSSRLSAFGRSDQTRADVSLPVSYEVDIFGQHKASGDAAELEVEATRAAYESTAMTLAANAAERWYDLVEARARRALAEEQLELNETYLELVELRFKQGLVSALDVHQQRQQAAQTRAQLSLIDAQIEALRQQLALLVGETPGQLAVGERDVLPELPPPPQRGVPADLLIQRPDVRAAQRRVEAADHRVGSAIASRLPSLLLTATPAYAFVKGETIVGQETNSGFEWSVGATLSVPLFDGFQRRGQTDLHRAQVREELANYQQTVHQAMVEVQTALAQEREQRKHIEDLEASLEVADEALQAARDRYRQGLTEFLPVLTALRTKQQAEQSLLEARRQLLSHRIQLHRALGGTWTSELEEPRPPPEERP